MKKHWLAQEITVNNKVCQLVDFGEDAFIAGKIKREALAEGAEYATIRVRKNAYFETYPESKGYTEKVYAVYARWKEEDDT